MSKGPTVTLTFAGDTANLEKSLSGMGSSVDRAGKDLDRTGRRAKSSADRFDRLSEAADRTDTKAMGFRDTITGVSDSIKGFSDESLSMEERLLTLGMGVGDLASGMANFLVPGLKDLSRQARTAATRVNTLMGRVKGLKTVVGTGIVIGVAFALDELTDHGKLLNEIAGNKDAGDMPSITESIGFLGEGEFSKAFGAKPPDGSDWNDVRNWPVLFPPLLEQVKTTVAGWATDMGAWFTGIWDSAGATLGQLPGSVGTWFSDMRTRAGERLAGMWETTRTTATGIVGSLTDGLSGLGERASGWFGRMRDAAGARAGELLGQVRSWPGRIMGALGNLGSMLWRSGSSLVTGFLNGIRSTWSRLMSWVSGEMGRLRGLWPFSPAKEGPFSGRGYVTHSGAALTHDFAESLRRGMPEVGRAAEQVMGAAALGVPSVGALTAARAGGAGAAAVSVGFHGNTADAVATLIMYLIRTGKIQIGAG